jgi:hypothetical protein
LLKVNLTVSHVGGGGLKNLGLAKEAMLMIHSHPVMVDIIVGEMNISSSQMLIGMPAMAAKIIMCMVRRHPRSKPLLAKRTSLLARN